MHICDRNQQDIETSNLTALLEHPDNFTVYAAGILRYRDLFMLLDAAPTSGSFNEFALPTFCFFNKRVEVENWKKYIWHGGKDSDIPWLGSILKFNDTSGDAWNILPERNLCAPINDRWHAEKDLMYRSMIPRVNRSGAETTIVISNAMQVRGLKDQYGRGGCGVVFTEQPSRDTINMGYNLAFEFPKVWVLANHKKFQPTQKTPRVSCCVDASHMYIGYESILQGLEEHNFSKLKEWFETNLKGLPDAEAKYNAMYEQSKINRRVV